MKKTFFLAATLASLGAFAQGTMVFNNRVAGVVVTHVYAPMSGNPTFRQAGNGSADTPAGTQDWTGFDLIGANGAGGTYEAATTFAQLLGANGPNQSEASLQPAYPTTIFQTGALAGFVVPRTATFENVPSLTDGATIEMVAWDNSSGLYPSWTEAVVAWRAGTIAAGESGPWTQPFLPDPAPSMFGAVSFNLYYIPEPGSFALIGLGAGLSFWFHRRAMNTGGQK